MTSWGNQDCEAGWTCLHACVTLLQVKVAVCIVSAAFLIIQMDHICTKTGTLLILILATFPDQSGQKQALMWQAVLTHSSIDTFGPILSRSGLDLNWASSKHQSSVICLFKIKIAAFEKWGNHSNHNLCVPSTESLYLLTLCLRKLPSVSVFPPAS